MDLFRFKFFHNFQIFEHVSRSSLDLHNGNVHWFVCTDELQHIKAFLEWRSQIRSGLWLHIMIFFFDSVRHACPVKVDRGLCVSNLPYILPAVDGIEMKSYCIIQESETHLMTRYTLPRVGSLKLIIYCTPVFEYGRRRPKWVTSPRNGTKDNFSLGVWEDPGLIKTN